MEGTDFVNMQALWSTCVLSTYVPSTILVSESSPRKAKDMVPFLEMPLACSKKKKKWHAGSREKGDLPQSLNHELLMTGSKWHPRKQLTGNCNGLQKAVWNPSPKLVSIIISAEALGKLINLESNFLICKRAPPLRVVVRTEVGEALNTGLDMYFMLKTIIAVLMITQGIFRV